VPRFTELAPRIHTKPIKLVSLGLPFNIRSSRLQFRGALLRKMDRPKQDSKVADSHLSLPLSLPLTEFTNKVLVGLFDALPPELVIRILEEARTQSASRPANVCILFPLRFLRVCRRWRSIIFAAPNLWKDVNIPGTRCIRSLEATRLFVELSRPYPMTLTWHHRPWNHDFVVQHVLRPGSDRWHTISIAGSTFNSRDSLSTILPNLSLPSLQSFRCEVLQGHTAFHADTVPEVTINAPKLRYWASVNCLLPSAHSLICLATLDIIISGPSKCLSVDRFLALLRATSRTLRHLKLVARDPPFDDRMLGVPRIRLPKLDVLELHNSADLLRRVIAPNLRTLCLHGDKETTAIPFSTLLEPTLIHLKLSMLPLHHLEDDPDFSFHFAALETVTLFSCKGTASVFSHAVPRRPGYLPFASLRSITISDTEAMSSIRFMLERLKISNPDLSSLEILRLVYRDGSAPKSCDVEWIVAQGMEFFGGRELGEPWSDTAFGDVWAVL